MKKNLVGTKNEYTRELWLKKVLKAIPDGKKILDAGAGERQYEKYCSHLHYLSQDFCKYRSGGNGSGLQEKSWNDRKVDIISDIINIPVRENEFDAVMCIEVLEHISDPAKVIKEFSRIIKPGGRLILTAPFCSLTHMAPYYYYNGFSKYWYEKTLNDNNFEIIEINYNGNFFEYLSQELRRIFFVEKKYTDIKITSKIKYKFGIKIVLELLDRLSGKNKNSEELLCFGLHVVANKK